ncbi:MAG TPA: hypothetical protein PKY20_04615 [Methanothrix sp.]|nr:hypothetical protein [Methanothrix sp.]HQE97464.1 hypothetical protein [Methanothrix sp.]
MLELEDANARAFDPSQVERGGLSQEMRQHIGCEGASEAWILLGSGHGDWVRYAAKWEVDREMSPDLMLCIVGGCRKRHEVSFSLKDTYY